MRWFWGGALTDNSSAHVLIDTWMCQKNLLPCEIDTPTHCTPLTHMSGGESINGRKIDFGSFPNVVRISLKRDNFVSGCGLSYWWERRLSSQQMKDKLVLREAYAENHRSTQHLSDSYSEWRRSFAQLLEFDEFASDANCLNRYP